MFYSSAEGKIKVLVIPCMAECRVQVTIRNYRDYCVIFEVSIMRRGR